MDHLNRANKYRRDIINCLWIVWGIIEGTIERIKRRYLHWYWLNQLGPEVTQVSASPILVPVPSTTGSFACIRPSPFLPIPTWCPTSSVCLFFALLSRICLYIIQRITKQPVAPPVTNNVSLLAADKCPFWAPQILAPVDTRPVEAAYNPGLGFQ